MNMDERYDYKKFAILYVDDEEQSLSMFRQNHEDEFRIYTAASAKEGLKILKAHPDDIGIVMSDQRMPGEKGVWLLEKARQLRPRVLRILATAYTDMDAAIQAVNAGSIFKYVTKPWDPMLLEQTLRRSLEFFILQGEREQLLKERRALLRERMIASRVVSLGLVSAGLNHHIGNRLQTIKLCLDLIEAGETDPDLLKQSRVSVDEILGLLNDLQTASTDQTISPFGDEVRLHSAVTDLLSKLQPALAAKRIAVENRIPENLPAFRTEKAKLQRLGELLFKFELGLLPAGSTIEITAKESPVNDKPGIAVTIRDNGPTQPQDTMRLVMDPLVVRGRPSEYSINLMVCFFIVRHHGGFIETSAPAEGGNQFVVHLPLLPETTIIHSDETQFLQRVLRNDELWEKAMSQT